MDFDDDLPRKEEQRPRKPKGLLMFLVLIFVVIMMLLWGKTAIGGAGKIAEVSVEEYLKQKSLGNVKAIRIEGDTLTADLHPGMGYVTDSGGKPYPKIRSYLPPAYLEDGPLYRSLSEGLDSKNVDYQRQNIFFQQLLLTFLPWVIIILIVWYFFFRQIRATGGPGNILS